MFDFFSKILGFFEVLWTFFQNAIDSLFNAVSFVAMSASFTVALVPYMPMVIGTAVMSFIAIFVLRFLIGRS